MTGSLRVLLVEDDWTVRSAVRDYLNRRQMEVVEADCAETALRVTVEHQPDVAVIDIVMPYASHRRASGTSVLRTSRTSEASWSTASLSQLSGTSQPTGSISPAFWTQPATTRSPSPLGISRVPTPGTLPSNMMRTYPGRSATPEAAKLEWCFNRT